jgi:hypothetical protein
MCQVNRKLVRFCSPENSMAGAHPYHVNLHKSGLLQPPQLVRQARGLINMLRVKVPVQIPLLSFEKVKSI